LIVIARARAIPTRQLLRLRVLPRRRLSSSWRVIRALTWQVGEASRYGDPSSAVITENLLLPTAANRRLLSNYGVSNDGFFYLPQRQRDRVLSCPRPLELFRPQLLRFRHRIFSFRDQKIFYIWWLFSCSFSVHNRSLTREHRQPSASDFADFWICCSLSKNKRHVSFAEKAI